MIRPPHLRGAFTTGSEGDLRHGSRRAVSHSLGISSNWATVRQVHSDRVVIVTHPGDAGEGDGLLTSAPDVPIAVFTADCLGVIIEGDDGAAVAHAGWRGLERGVVATALAEMVASGMQPRRAAIGPSIGPCCFEVGAEVLREFPVEFHSQTSWRTPSLDLRAVAARQLGGLEVWNADLCTRCESGYFSHRRDGTSHRMAALTWTR